MLSLRTRDSAALRSAVATQKGEATVEQHTSLLNASSSASLPSKTVASECETVFAEQHTQDRASSRPRQALSCSYGWDANDGWLVAQGGSPAVPPVGTRGGRVRWRGSQPEPARKPAPPKPNSRDHHRLSRGRIDLPARNHAPDVPLAR